MEQPAAGSSLAVFEGDTFSLSSGDLAFLQSALPGNIEVRAGGVAVRRVVGHAVLPSGTVLRVRSGKSSARSVLAWLAYCDPSLASLRFLPISDGTAGSGDLAAVTARLFADEVLRVTHAHGLPRTYLRTALSSTVVRGRIDFARQARALASTGRIACVVWERGADAVINRWLASALHAIEVDALMRDACLSQLPALRTLLEGFVPLSRSATIEPLPRLPRHLHHLERALALAGLLVRRCHLDEGTETRGASFFVNLEALFEQTVARAFLDAGVSATPKYPARYTRSVAGLTSTRAMQIDLFCDTSSGGLVIDAKFRTHVTPGNLQQMVTYCHLTGARRAVLVFPAGHLPGRAVYRLRSPGGDAITVESAELRTDAQHVDDWPIFGRALVRDILYSDTGNAQAS